MVVRDLFHAPGTPPLIPNEEVDWWTLQLVWAFWRIIILEYDL
jgi:hypothetical protein